MARSALAGVALAPLLLTLLFAASTAALSLQSRPVRCAHSALGLSHRAQHARMSEEPAAETAKGGDGDGSKELSPETILQAAKAASDYDMPMPEKKEPEPFDPRIILYVSLPALVLGAQLFFTFSRDALTGDAVGPAVMDLWIP